MGKFDDLINAAQSTVGTPVPMENKKQKKAAKKQKNKAKTSDRGTSEFSSADDAIKWAAEKTLKTDIALDDAKRFFSASALATALLVEALRTISFYNTADFRRMCRQTVALLESAEEFPDEEKLELLQGDITDKETRLRLIAEQEELSKKECGGTKKGINRYNGAVHRSKHLCLHAKLPTVLSRHTKLAADTELANGATFALFAAEHEGKIDVVRIATACHWKVHSRYVYSTQILGGMLKLDDLCVGMLGRIIDEKLRKQLDETEGMSLRDLSKALYDGSQPEKCSERLQELFGVAVSPDDLALQASEEYNSIAAIANVPAEKEKPKPKKKLPTPRKRKETAPKQQEQNEKKKKKKSPAKKRKREPPMETPAQVTDIPEPSEEIDVRLPVEKSAVLGHPETLCPVREHDEVPLLCEFEEISALHEKTISEFDEALLVHSAKLSAELFATPTIEKNTAPAQKLEQIDEKTGKVTETTTSRTALHAQSSRTAGLQRNSLTSGGLPGARTSETLADAKALAKCFSPEDCVSSSQLHDVYAKAQKTSEELPVADALKVCRSAVSLEKSIATILLQHHENGRLWPSDVNSAEADVRKLLASLGESEQFQAYVARLLVHSHNLQIVDEALTATPAFARNAKPLPLQRVPALGETEGNGFDPLKSWVTQQ